MISPMCSTRPRTLLSHLSADQTVIEHTTPLILGSSSPRRRQILETLSIPIRVIPAEADEIHRDGESPEEYLQRIVLDKLKSAAARVGTNPCGGLLVADTIVLRQRRILGKPKDLEDACRTLHALSGKAHEVHTRFAIAVPTNLSVPIHQQTVCTTVHFRSLTDDEIIRYATSGEGMDKAGAYAAQGLGSFAVERIDGSFSNVVGLPTCEVVLALLQTRLLLSFPP